LINVLPRHRRIIKKVSLGVRNEARELLRFLINPMKHRSDGEKLECAAHGKALAGAVLEAPATAGVECGDTQPSAEAHLDRFDAPLRRVRASGRLIGGSRGICDEKD